ncbi:hypothetical protein WJ97_13035 [Burkholderia ubonensis]|nr:hypothetical protein WJ97_13035 [Burkholderia ubonensis]
MVEVKVGERHPFRIIKLTGLADNREIIGYTDAETDYSDNSISRFWLSVSLLSMFFLTLNLLPKKGIGNGPRES